jgi:hypothetical protein
LRRPKGWRNWLFESFLINSQRELFNGEYKIADTTLRWTNWMLNIVVH